MLKTLFLASVFAASAFAHDTAYVPFKVNVGAAVKMQQGTKIVTESVTANTLKTLRIVLEDNTPIKPSITPKSVTMRSSRGRLSLGLPSQLYKNAEIALYSLSGKRVMHGKAEAAKSISHPNIAMGVYLLNVKGNGNTFSTRFTHQGGGMTINVAFEDASFAPLKKEEFGVWNITVSAQKYYDSSYTLNVTKGNNPQQNITLRSPVPTIPEAMSGKTALQFFRDNDIKAGWNLGSTLDAVTHWETPMVTEETVWGNPKATQALFNGVKQSGFDIVRIPCTWIGLIGPTPDYTISEARLKRIAEVIGYAKTAGIKVIIINMHEDGHTDGDGRAWGFVNMPAAINDAAKKSEIRNQLSKVWTQVAEYFKNYGDYLIFETLNEVHSGNWGNGSGPAYENEQDILFDWNQAALSAIRATGGNNATRFVAVPGLGGTEPDIVVAANNRNKLLPDDGANGKNKLIVAVHYYTPGQYTVAEENNESFPLIHTWGTQAERNALNHNMELLKTNFIDNGIAVYFGENGAQTDTRSNMSQTIKDTHLDYITSVATAARQIGIPPIYWDNGADFKILERSNGRPKTGLWADVLSAIMDAVNNTTPPDGGKVIGGGFIIGEYTWNAFNDAYNNGTSSITISEEPSGTVSISGNVTTAYQYGFVGWQAVPSSAELANLKTATSISFKVKGDGKTYKIILPTSDITDYSHYLTTFTAGATETTITVNLPGGLSSPGWGESNAGTAFNQNLVSLIEWQTANGATGEFNLTIRDLELSQ